MGYIYSGGKARENRSSFKEKSCGFFLRRVKNHTASLDLDWLGAFGFGCSVLFGLLKGVLISLLSKTA